MDITILIVYGRNHVSIIDLSLSRKVSLSVEDILKMDKNPIQLWFSTVWDHFSHTWSIAAYFDKSNTKPVVHGNMHGLL